jgi:hypothetical protein
MDTWRRWRQRAGEYGGSIRRRNGLGGAEFCWPEQLMNKLTQRGAFLVGSLCFTLAESLVGAETAPVQPPASFEGGRTAWHGFDRYDFLMDEATLGLKPVVGASEVQGQRSCIVVTPRVAAPGNPWCWRGCYWDHEPQTEIELLQRGFNIAHAGQRVVAAGEMGRLVRIPHEARPPGRPSSDEPWRRICLHLGNRPS